MENLKQPFMKNRPEIWSPVTMYPVRPGMYMVSDAGRVMNNITGHIMSQNYINTGYLVVSLCTIFGDVRHFLVHRLVATEFIPNPENKETVNHLDHKIMNYSDYLEWATQAENNKHTRDTGRNNIVGEDNYAAKFTNEQVKKICDMLSIGLSYKAILEVLDMPDTDNNRDLIGNIKRGIAWVDISKDYIFLPDDKYTGIFDEFTIHDICMAIAKGLTIREIIETVLNITYVSCSTVNKREYECIRKIKNKLQYKEISDLYF